MNVKININKEILFWTNAVLKFLDIILTTFIVSTYGIASESNPVVRYCIESYGLLLTMIYTFLAHMGLIWYLYKKNKKDILFIMAILMSILILINSLATFIQ